LHDSMQPQMEKEKGALVGESSLKMVSTTVREMTPLGIKLEINQQGQFAGAKYNAIEFGTNSVYLKMDGTMEWEVKIVQTTPEGEIVVESGRGTGKNLGGGKVRAEGEALMMSQSPKLAAVNNSKLWAEAEADLMTGEVHVKLYGM